MEEELLPETRIGDFLTIGCELVEEHEEIGLFIASADVSASCGFKYDEWENFVQGINRAHESFKALKKEG